MNQKCKKYSFEEVFEQRAYRNSSIYEHYGGPEPDIAETRISERFGTAF